MKVGGSISISSLSHSIVVKETDIICGVFSIAVCCYYSALGFAVLKRRIISRRKEVHSECVNLTANSKVFFFRARKGQLEKVNALMMLNILFVSTFLPTLVPSVKANGTIHIRNNGSIDPPNVPIVNDANSTYTLTDNIQTNADGIVVERDNIVIDGNGNVLQGLGMPSHGIDLSERENVTIRNIKIEAFNVGVYVWFPSNSSKGRNSIERNDFRNNTYAIYIDASHGNRIVQNNITNNDSGIKLYSSHNNSISDNFIANNNHNLSRSGVILHLSNCNNITRNNITSNKNQGLKLITSHNNSINGNSISFGYFGIRMMSGCSANKVCQNHITRNNEGINTQSSFDTSITNNYVSYCSRGINLGGSSDKVSYNTITENTAYGILVHGSGNNIRENKIISNGEGIAFEYAKNNCILENDIVANMNWGFYFSHSSSNNSLTENNVVENRISICAIESSGNHLWHNNFLGNYQAFIDESTNLWDDGYEGNYWSNYNGTDSDGDGIGDTPYIIDDLNRDNYPLMAPYIPCDVNHDATIDIYDVAKIATVFGRTTVDQDWNPALDVNKDKMIDVFDLVTTALSFGKHWNPP